MRGSFACVGVRMANEQLGPFFKKDEEKEILDLRTIGGSGKKCIMREKDGAIASHTIDNIDIVSVLLK